MFFHSLNYESICVLSALCLDIQTAAFVLESAISLRGQLGQTACILQVVVAFSVIELCLVSHQLKFSSVFSSKMLWILSHNNLQGATPSNTHTTHTEFSGWFCSFRFSATTAKIVKADVSLNSAITALMKPQEFKTGKVFYLTELKSASLCIFPYWSTISDCYVFTQNGDVTFLVNSYGVCNFCHQGGSQSKTSKHALTTSS